MSTDKTEALIPNEIGVSSEVGEDFSKDSYVHKLPGLKPWIKLVYGTGDFSCGSQLFGH